MNTGNLHITSYKTDAMGEGLTGWTDVNIFSVQLL